MSVIALVVFLMGLMTAVGLALYAAWSDFRGFRIPNFVSLAMIGAFAAVYGALTLLDARTAVFAGLPGHLTAAGLVFAVTLALYLARVLGAGDSKFATAVALWLGLQGLSAFLMVMSLVGGLLAVASLVLARRRLFPAIAGTNWIARAQDGSRDVPYGIAITAGMIAGFVHQGYLSPERWAALLGG